MLQRGFAWFAAAAFAASLGWFLYAYLVLFDTTTGTAGALLIDVLLFTGFALHHSVFARTRIKTLVRRWLPSLERSVYTLTASVLFTGVCVAWQPVDGVAWSLDGVWRWLGFGVQALGILLTIVGGRSLDVLELAGVRQTGAGSDRPLRLKTDGLYGFVRHPLYFAWVLFVFGAPDMTMTRLTFAVVSTAYLAVAIPFEERSLIETFGPEYASYRQKVRSRMLPGLY